MAGPGRRWEMTRRPDGRRSPPKIFGRRIDPQWVSAYGRSLFEAVRYRDQIAEVERFCFFIGYPRSGHSLIGSLIDAHPEVVIANELDAFRYFAHGFGRAQVYGLLLWREKQFSDRGREKGDLNYAVPGAHQGSATRLRVIGDKRGTATAVRLAGDISLLNRVRRAVGVPIRVIQHSRNPFDTIATAARQRVGDDTPRVVPAIRWYEHWSRNLALVRPHLQPDELLDTHHEQLVADPREALTRVCQFLGVDADPTYLDQCASIVWPSPRLSRHSVAWTSDQIESVEQVIAAHSWLSGYAFSER
jgi:Sulfotransferase family